MGSRDDSTVQNRHNYTSHSELLSIFNTASILLIATEMVLKGLSMDSETLIIRIRTADDIPFPSSQASTTAPVFDRDYPNSSGHL